MAMHDRELRTVSVAVVLQEVESEVKVEFVVMVVAVVVVRVVVVAVVPVPSRIFCIHGAPFKQSSACEKLREEEPHQQL